PVFEMYPIGFTTIASKLSTNGYRVRILNLAAHMLADDSYDVEKAIGKLRSRVFGIDLHWLPHAHGSIEIGKIVKSLHPNSKLIFGGFSSTYFWREMMADHPMIDAIFIGDSTEKPLLAYFRALDKTKAQARQNAVDKVPNLVHRHNGRIVNNGLSYVPDSLDDVDFDYGWMVKNVIKTMDLEGHMPYLDWKNRPMSLVLSVHGCVYNCVTCMGSCQTFKSDFNRKRPAYRSPKKMMEDILQADSYIRGTIFILGDIQQPGKKYYTELFRLLKKNPVRNNIAIEFFVPPSKDFVQQLGSTLDSFDCQISPDSHDEEVRKAQGRCYTNASMERSIHGLVEAGANRVDVFYMIGLPKQDRQSVLDTVKYSAKLLKDHAKTNSVSPFIAPLAPFVDPGSMVFNDPEKHGYTIFARSLKEHRDLLLQPTWKHVLNYETKWLDRAGLVDVTYESGLRMSEAKLRAGLLTEASVEAVKDRTRIARQIIETMDEAIRTDTLMEARERINGDMDLVSVSESSTMDKRELDWSNKSLIWSIPRALTAIMMGK
ncbi:MAG: TIGR04190 family B12-binding domain/radical SAM domain protein, partial [Thermoplasmata archaeon]|nr:TIGR04190 family B12-binding domain/radical SAM domain protein [Thermoplasmata archaeon]